MTKLGFEMIAATLYLDHYPPGSVSCEIYYDVDALTVILSDLIYSFKVESIRSVLTVRDDHYRVSN